MDQTGIMLLLLNLMMMILYIKNMVCGRCITIVKAELDKLGIPYIKVDLGEVTIRNKLTPGQQTKLYIALQQSGLELIGKGKTYLIEKVKNAIADLEHYSDEDLKTSFSDYISLSVNDNFISLNALFAEIEGITIEKYIIQHKIEIVKKMLIYDDFNLAEIAFIMHYSNTAQLSSQFKNITGLSPSFFRQLHTRKIDPQVN